MKVRFVFALALFAAARLALAWEIVSPEARPAPKGLQFTTAKAVEGSQSVELHVVAFSPRTHTLAVMDNPERAFDLGTASLKRGALAAVNGGYFQPDRTPLGLVVRQGTELHPLEHARLLSGLVTVAGGRVSLLRFGEFKPSPAVHEALQAGPFLIDGGKPVAGLNATRAAARTVVWKDDAGRCGLLVCRFATLAETAQILIAPGVVGAGKITRALNLDGGSSTGLWVAGEPPFYLHEGKDVRNYLAIVAK